MILLFRVTTNSDYIGFVYNKVVHNPYIMLLYLAIWQYKESNKLD